MGHWYEAQLLHYGLAPSKNKAVAKVRLLDAVRGGGLKVPREILKVEGDLKREWKKKDKEARNGGGASAVGTAGTARAGAKSTAGGNKRKRDGEESTPTPKATARKTKAANSTPAKKAETGAGTGAKKTAAKPTAKKSEPEPLPTVDPARPRTKQTAKCSRGGATISSRGGSTAGSRNSQTPAASTDPEPAQPPRAKQAAKFSRGRGDATASSRGGISQTPAASTESPESARGPRTKQTARRSKPFFGDRRPIDPLYKQEYSTPVNHSSPEYVGLLCNLLAVRTSNIHDRIMDPIQWTSIPIVTTRAIMVPTMVQALLCRH